MNKTQKAVCAALITLCSITPLKTESKRLNHIKIPYMANIELLIPKILAWEGGYQNDPADSGNYYDGKLIGTNHGIAAPTLANYLGRTPTVEDMKAVTKDTAVKIMKTGYWDKWRADEIHNQSIAEILVDWVWASGVWGIKIPQRILGVADDGVVGAKTIHAVNTYGNDAALHAIIQQKRIDFVEDICRKNPKNKKFKRGWINRINSFTYEP